MAIIFILLLLSSLRFVPIATIIFATTIRRSISMSLYKRVKLDTSVVSSKVIGTHSGTFQADEAMGVWMLRQLADYRNSKIVRTRDDNVLKDLDIVLDVGGVYNHEIKRYDHHQRDYDEYFTPGRCTKLSASGLIYRHYGKELLRTHYPSLSEQDLDWAFVKIYDSLLEALDAIDTGVEPANSLLYKDSTGLSKRVGRLNPRWNEVLEDGAEPDPDQRFQLASDLCGQDFMDVMVQIIESDLPARTIVEQAVLDRFKVHESGEVICFPTGGLPWRGHLYELEKQHNLDKEIKFVLYTDQAGMWRVQAVTVEGKAFENRLSLPQAWRGVRDKDLSQVAGIPGCTFCHASGFIGGNETYEGALEMAKVSLSDGKGGEST
jgi:uncharacterized UPF0160 family protein